MVEISLLQIVGLVSHQGNGPNKKEHLESRSLGLMR